MIRNCRLIFIATFGSIFFSSATVLPTPLLQHKFGSPLYDGVKLLIADERFNAQLIWNITAYHLTEFSHVLEKTLDQLENYNPTERLKALNDVVRNPSWSQCYKEYERQIAHFNREFITKYGVCKQTLDVAIAHLEEETFQEIDFIRNAALEIQRVVDVCKVSNLKRMDQDHVGIMLCVMAEVGKIDQRLFESSQLVWDIIAEVTMNADIDRNDNCHAYNELKQEVDRVYSDITECLDGPSIDTSAMI